MDLDTSLQVTQEETVKSNLCTSQNLMMLVSIRSFASSTVASELHPELYLQDLE